ncbi:MAG: toprim domain-containing protein [Solirubrobacteraceae bacterium]
MTLMLPGADIRGYYAALGIQLPGWAHTEASIRCFADPDAHRRGDRDPSCSVNLEHGAWHCHACGAKGGPYDAALAKRYTERSAIDLMIRHGLAERRSQALNRSHPVALANRRAGNGAVERKRRTRTLTIREPDVQRWQSALATQAGLIARLARERGWRYPTMRELDLGADGNHITIPTRDHDGQLVGLLRYRPWPAARQAKMRAAPGSQRVLLPHPAAEPSQQVLLVEGEPDMIAARSRGLAAIALPGTDTWRPHWAQLLAGRQVTIVTDSDPQGRALAERIARDLGDHPDTAIVDLAPERNDGYDLTDWLVVRPGLRSERLEAELHATRSVRSERELGRRAKEAQR